MRPVAIALVACAVALLSACANPYSQYYKGTADVRGNAYYDSSGGPVRVLGMTTPKQDIDNLFRRGYVLIGESNFTAPSSTSERLLIEQANKIGAHVVLSSAQYQNTVQGAIPMTVPTTNTSYTTGSATAFGAGGSVSAYGNSTTTTYGQQTTMIPYSVDRSSFRAAYFAKVKMRLGIMPEEVEGDARRALGVNGGARVRAVATNSGAFDADILEGDIIMSIAGRKITGVEGFNSRLDGLAGQTVEVILIRDGKELRKQTQIRY